MNILYGFLVLLAVLLVLEVVLRLLGWAGLHEFYDYHVNGVVHQTDKLTDFSEK